MAENIGRITARVPLPLQRALERYVEEDTYMSSSEFVRTAVREKLEELAPEMLREEVQRGG